MDDRASKTQRKLLDAAERLVLEVGVGQLTLAAVARAAGVSKGGLLYHFPSKEELLKAMVGRYARRFEQDWDALATRDPEARGRHTRGYINATLGEVENTQQGLDSLGASLIAAIANDPRLLDPIRRHYGAWQSAIEDDGLDPVLATVLRFAIDGLWMTEVFGFAKLPPELRGQVVERLMALTRGGAATARLAG